VGSAHLKTGSLQDVLAIAGYVHGDDGRRWVLVALVNHDRAGAARPALDALIDWTRSEGQP
jgi:serine-type D-Ala-D-Ala carboxypeptidase/endopeptidase (penicillin-binding protein 4)